MKEHEDQFKINFPKTPENANKIDKEVLPKENEIIADEGEFHKDYLDEFEEEEEIPIIHLNEEELKKMAKDSDQIPEYHALMIKIAEAQELEHNERMNKIAEELEKKEKINDLEESIGKALDGEEEKQDRLDNRDDNSGGRKHFTEIAQKQKEEAKKIEEDLIRFRKEGGKYWKLDQ